MKNLFVLPLVYFLSFASTLSVAQEYEIYVSDAGNFNNPPWQILKFDPQGKNPTVFIDTLLNWPQDILFLEDSNIVLIPNLGSNSISRHNATTGDYINAFAQSISGPTRIKIGPDGLLYVLQWNGNNKVRRYQLDGTFVDEFTEIGVPQSIGLDWDKDNNLYVSSYNGDLVRKFDTAGKDLGLFIQSRLAGPTNIWFDMNGELLVADYDGTAVKRFDSGGNYLSDFMTGLSKCEGVARYPNGNYLIGNGASRSVKMFDSSGTYLSDFISSGSGNLRTPNAVVLREVATVPQPKTVQEISTDSAPRIYPTVGSNFFIRSEYLNEIDSIEIYTLEGKLIKAIVPQSDLLWDAGTQNKGQYLIVIKGKDGSVSTERIQVIF